MNRYFFTRLIILFTIFHFTVMGSLAPVAKASMVSTQAVLQEHTPQDTRMNLDNMLARDDVRMELVRLGVDPAIAIERMKAMTTEELQQFSGQLEDLPAGAGALEVIGIVFLVLLILELVGVTNVFTRV